MAIPSLAYERNREPILQVLKQVITPEVKHLLEIGSGSGHHAVYMAPRFPHLEWVTSDLPENHSLIQETLMSGSAANISGPLDFEIGRNEVSLSDIDMIFSANTLHIMNENKVKTLIELLGRGLKLGSQVLFYGPFNYNGRFTSESNAEFDRWLKSVEPGRGIRAFEDICAWMKAQDFDLVRDFEMPANNRILHFQKMPAS